MILEGIREGIATAEKANGAVEMVMGVADRLLGDADKGLEIAEETLEKGRRALPKVIVGLAVVGVGVAAVLVLRRKRAAGADAQVWEQPEDGGSTGGSEAEMPADFGDAVEEVVDEARDEFDAAAKEAEAVGDSLADTTTKAGKSKKK